MKWAYLTVTMDNGEDIDIIRKRMDNCGRQFLDALAPSVFATAEFRVEQAMKNGTLMQVCDDRPFGKKVTISGAHIAKVTVHTKEE